MFKNKNEFMDELHKELVKSFGIIKKESYGYDEVYQIVDQLKERSSGVTHKLINNYIETAEKEYNEEVSKLENANSDVDKDQEEKLQSLQKTLEEKEKEVAELTTKLDNANTNLKPYQEQKKKETAKELLNGLVLTGAEWDAYEKLQDKIKEIEFSDESTIVEKQELIKPLVEELLQTKTYLKPKIINNGKVLATGEKPIVGTKEDSEESNVQINKGIAA